WADFVSGYALMVGLGLRHEVRAAPCRLRGTRSERVRDGAVPAGRGPDRAQEAACRGGIETAPQGRQARAQRRVLEQRGECEGILAEQLGKRGRGGVGEKGRSMTP